MLWKIDVDKAYSKKSVVTDPYTKLVFEVTLSAYLVTAFILYHLGRNKSKLKSESLKNIQTDNSTVITLNVSNSSKAMSLKTKAPKLK